MGWLAAQGAIMAIVLFIGIVCSVIGLFFGHINSFDSKMLMSQRISSKIVNGSAVDMKRAFMPWELEIFTEYFLSCMERSDPI